MATSNNSLALALVQAGVALSPSGTAPKIAPKRKATAKKAAPKAKAKGKVKALTSTQLSTVNAIPSAAFQYARNKANVVALVKAIGANANALKATQRGFHVGYIAFRLNPTATAITAVMMAQAQTVLDSAGKDAKKLADGQSRRNAEQEKAYGASRTAWKVIMFSANAKATDKRGGKRKPRTPKGETVTDATKDMLQAIPKAKDKADASQYLLQQSATMLAYCNKNAKALTPQQTSAVSDFHAAIKACCT